MNTYDIVQYYKDLLILQYNGKDKAAATIGASVTPFIMPQTTTETIVFSATPASGTFVLSYDGNSTAPINWNDSTAAVQTALQALPGLSTVTVGGSIAAGLLLVTFTGVVPPAQLLVLISSTLEDVSSDPISIMITETDVTMPVAVQDAFNVTAPAAVGVQQDVIGKYVGVSRSGEGFTGPIVLGDADFAKLIQMGIIQNSSGSSLYEIVKLLQQFFPGEILVFDSQLMTMDYIIAYSVGPQELIQLFITEGLLPRPMAVRIRLVLYVPFFDLFGFRTYGAPGFHVFPFNTYATYHTDWPWLSYANAFLVA